MEKTLHVILLKPTPEVDFGLQKGHGNNYEIVQRQRSTKGKDLQFEFAVTVKNAKDGSTDFGGPFVQGKRGDRYFYISIGTYAGQSNTPWSRRLKVPLSGITQELIDSKRMLVARIPGTGRDGGPSCAYTWLKGIDPPWEWSTT
jgi:hypothetical protein